MTHIGSGGVQITTVELKKCFKRDFKKLDPQLKKLTEDKIEDLYKYPHPPGLRFEKLSGIRNPDVYTFHVTGNYKVSLEIYGSTASLRRVGNHDLIDRSP